MGYVPPQGAGRGGGARAFTELEDTPSSYSGGGGKGVKVKATEDGLEFGDVASKFTELTDAPSSYSGAAGKGVRVNTAEDGLEFAAVPRAATLVVAASDSKNPTDADKTCDGSGDEVEINAAIGELP